MDPKPGYKTTEFWLTAIGTALGFLFTQGVITEDQIAALVGYANIVLLPLGYTVSRAVIKTKS